MEEENGLSSEPDYGKPKTQPNNSQGKITLYLLFSVFVVALGSAQFGFSISAPNYIINGITGKRPNGTEYNCMKFRYESFIKGCVNMNSTEKSLFLSIIYAGCILGSIFGGLLSDLIERKTSLLISNIFFIVGNMCLSLFSNVLLLIVGIGVGIISVVVPIYLTEIASTEFRGVIGSFHQVSLNTAILSAQILGFFLDSPFIWRIMMVLPIFIAFLQNLLLPYVPMSPRWLILIGLKDTAEYELKSLRGQRDVKLELKTFENNNGKNGRFHSIFALKKLFTLSIIKRLIQGFALHFFQQFSGINIIIFYGFDKFKELFQNPIYVSIILNLTNIISSLACLLFIRYFKKVKLLLFSEILTFFSFIAFNILYISFNPESRQVYDVLILISTIIFMFGYSMGLGPLPWVMMTEIFPSDIRGISSGLCVSINWVSTFLVSLYPVIFPENKWAMVIFPVFTLFSIFFTYYFVKETEGLPLEKINENL